MLFVKNSRKHLPRHHCWRCPLQDSLPPIHHHCQPHSLAGSRGNHIIHVYMWCICLHYNESAVHVLHGKDKTNQTKASNLILPEVSGFCSTNLMLTYIHCVLWAPSSRNTIIHVYQNMYLHILLVTNKQYIVHELQISSFLRQQVLSHILNTDIQNYRLTLLGKQWYMLPRHVHVLVLQINRACTSKQSLKPHPSWRGFLLRSVLSSSSMCHSRPVDGFHRTGAAWTSLPPLLSWRMV